MRKKEYIISFNEGVITENSHNRILFERGLSFEKADNLFSSGVGVMNGSEDLKPHCDFHPKGNQRGD